MNILKESDFRKELKSSPRSAYLFFGEEDYLKAFAVRSARELLCPDPSLSFFNDVRLDALDFEPQKLSDALMPVPMMSDKKLITLSGLNFNAMRPSDLDALCDALSAVDHYDHNLLLVVAAADALDVGYLPKRPSSILTRLCEHLTPVQFDRSSPAKLSAWVEKHFSHNGVSASPALCSLMIDYCGRSMFVLANEIDKVSYYVLSQQRSELSQSDLLKVCCSVSEYDAFAFANAFMEGRRDKALDILSDYKFRRVDPIAVLSEIIRVFCDMKTVSVLAKDGTPSSEIASLTKLHEFRVNLYLKSLNRISDSRLDRAIAVCSQADAAIKLSAPGYAPIEQLICSI